MPELVLMRTLPNGVVIRIVRRNYSIGEDMKLKRLDKTSFSGTVYIPTNASTHRGFLFHSRQCNTAREAISASIQTYRMMRGSVFS